MEVGDYRPPFPLFNRHLETIYPALFRKVKAPSPQRERISTSDDDFLDLDWMRQGSDKLVIVSHGLEGNSRRAYVMGMARAFYLKGFDALAWNYRGCGEEMNRRLRFYHSGASDDLHCVVTHAVSQGYRGIFLVGFSLGGNVTLKYLGETGQQIVPAVKGAATFSVPLNLDGSCTEITKRSNFLYALRFLRSLKKKVVNKSRIMKGIDVTGIGSIRTLRQFDDRYTAPLHGFVDAAEYYKRCSSLYFLNAISVPTLVVNARNDPFLSPDCYPVNLSNPKVTLEYPGHGGHVGFAQFRQNGLYWSEARALQFIESITL
jgi:predicted alpha/beta-fold hydrolase